MQKLSQTEELARSLAAKARRHTLTTEQISRTYSKWPDLRALVAR